MIWLGYVVYFSKFTIVCLCFFGAAIRSSLVSININGTPVTGSLPLSWDTVHFVFTMLLDELLLG